MHELLGGVLIWAALLLMIGMVYASETNMHLGHAHWLVPASLWLVWPHRNPRMRQLQEVAFFYLVLLVFLTAIPVYWDISQVWTGTVSMRISITAGCVLLAVAGYAICLWRAPRQLILTAPGEGPILLGVSVLLLLGLTLFATLQARYGYGCERDRYVAGRLGLCIILAALLKPVAESYWQRASVGVLMATLLLRGT